MKSIKVMLLGIGILLIGILCRTLSIGYNTGNFISEIIPFFSLISGVIIIVIGFFAIKE